MLSSGNVLELPCEQSHWNSRVHNSVVQFSSCDVNEALLDSTCDGQRSSDDLGQFNTRRSPLCHRCKNVFYFFLFWSLFYVFNFFYIPNVFFILKNVGKVQSGKQINKKHFQITAVLK